MKLYEASIEYNYVVKDYQHDEKYYEDYIKKIKTANKQYSVIDCDNSIQKVNFEIEKIGPQIGSSDTREKLFYKVNKRLQEIGDKDNAIFFAGFSDKEFYYMAKIKDKNRFEYMLKNINEYMVEYFRNGCQKFFRYGDETYLDISSVTKYKEISSKEFLIDLPGFVYDNPGIGNTEYNTKKYMKFIEEYNYDVTDLSRRSNRLDYTFITEYEPNVKLSYDEFTKKYNTILFNNDIKEEVERIYNTENNNKMVINPIHYEISIKDMVTRENIFKCLSCALYSNDRITKKYPIKLKIDIYDNYVTNDSLEAIIRNEEGGLIFLDFAQNRQCYVSDHQYFNGNNSLKQMTDIIDKYKNKVQFVFFFEDGKDDMKNEILDNLRNIKLVTIGSDIGNDNVDLYVNNILNERHLKKDEKLTELLDLVDKDVTEEKIENIIDEWQNDKIIKKYFPLYDKYVRLPPKIKRNEDPYKALMSMVGLENVKKVLDQIIDYTSVEKLKKEKFIAAKKEQIENLQYDPISMPLHMCFMGNPGTAKTTVARLLCKILYKRKLIKSERFIEYNTKNDSLQECFKKAYGGILFIDEAYQYMCVIGFVPTLLELMETYKNDVIVILAGYNQEMNAFLKSNPGFESRIKFKIEFDDYDEDELWQILNNMAKERGLVLKGKNIRKKLEPLLSTAQAVKNLGNGRLMRNVLDEAIMKQASRLSKCGNIENISYEGVNTLISEDFDIDFKTITNVKILDIDKDPYKELDNMIGLSNVKKMVKMVVGSSKIKMKREKNDKLIKVPMHLVFFGNPGTGKTSVARLFARIMKKEGIIKSPAIVEVGRKDLIGGFVGSTAPLVAQAFEKAKGGVLFIDEAYSLLDGNNGGYGEEAINAIVQEMENRRDEVIVIFGGYTDRMMKFISNNEGMKSRINYYLGFKNYDVNEMYAIFEKICHDKKIIIEEGIEPYLKRTFEKVVDSVDYMSIGNGRYVRKIVEGSMLNMDYRISKMADIDLTDKILYTLTLQDVKEAMKGVIIARLKEKQKVGFAA